MSYTGKKVANPKFKHVLPIPEKAGLPSNFSKYMNKEDFPSQDVIVQNLMKKKAPEQPIMGHYMENIRNHVTNKGRPSYLRTNVKYG